MTSLKIPSFLFPSRVSIGLHGGMMGLLLMPFLKKPAESQHVVEVVWKAAPTPCLSQTEKKISEPLQRQRNAKKEVHRNKSIKNKISGSSTRESKGHPTSSPPPLTLAKDCRPPSSKTLHRPLPSYPWVCRKRQQEGVVCLQVATNHQGQVIEAHLHKSSGHPLLDKAALEAVQAWILTEENSQKILSIAFRLTGENVSIS